MKVCTVEPRLSGPRLSGTSIIRHGLPAEKRGGAVYCACAESHGKYLLLTVQSSLLSE